MSLHVSQLDLIMEIGNPPKQNNGKTLPHSVARIHFISSLTRRLLLRPEDVVDYALMIIISRHPTEKEPHNNGPAAGISSISYW